MSLSVGIVGLPNAGKSTLFNALASRRLSETAPRAFTTIDPHEASVALQDEDLRRLSEMVKPQTTVPAAVDFIDIAGLVKGAHRGEGLGNQFLSKIREVDLIVQVVRAFIDPMVTHQHRTHEPGTLEQVLEDIEIISLELQIANIKKPTIYVLNFDDKRLGTATSRQYEANVRDKYGGEAISVSAKLEEDFIDLEEKEKADYIKELGLERSGLEKLIGSAYKRLDLISFYTIKGGKEVHAWSLKKGENAIEAAGVVHSDFQKGFIKAEVIFINELLELGGWKEAKDAGKVRLEGKEYIIKDKDVIEFKVNI